MGVIDGVRGRLRSGARQSDSLSTNTSGAGAPVTRHEGETSAGLKARRDELAAQVSELHWDLGGLAYEMAIRDHFRLDVLVRRAAALQERDAELAELERLLALEQDAGAHSRTPARTLPGPGVASLLVCLMLGFGVLTGSAARGSAHVAQPHRKLTLLLGAAQAGPDATAAAASHTALPPSLGAVQTPSPTAAASTSTVAPSSGADNSETPAEEAPKTKPQTQPKSQSKATSTPAVNPAPSKSTLPPVKHVFLIVLADEPYSATFGPSSPAPYLAHTLEQRGELLARYYGVAHDELANEIALVSGLAPTVDTAANCPTFLDVTPATPGKDGQYAGNGCVYPSSVQNVGDQLLAKQLSWKVYAEDMEHGGVGQPVACRHPAFGAPDTTAVARPGDAFATYRDPFSYFDSVIDAPRCGQEDVGLSALHVDLAQAKRTPTLSYIVPNLCHDGREAPCTPGAPAGLPAAEGFLRSVVPEILASPAYKQGGLLVITTDEAPTSGPSADSSSCCGQPSFPGIPGNQATVAAPPSGKLPAPGGGQVGALLISPYVKPHTFDQEPFNHFSLLRTIEDLFGLDHLGYAGLSGVSSFSASVFSAYAAG